MVFKKELKNDSTAHTFYFKSKGSLVWTSSLETAFSYINATNHVG
jgi:hypothetical protein